MTRSHQPFVVFSPFPDVDVTGFKLSSFELFAVNRYASLIVFTFTGLLGNHAPAYCSDVGLIMANS